MFPVAQLRQGYRSLVLNLEGVSYMDSTCLGEIIAAYAMLKDHGGRLKLLNVPGRIQHLLDLAKLTMIETALGSDETAVGGFVAAEQIDSHCSRPSVPKIPLGLASTFALRLLSHPLAPTGWDNQVFIGTLVEWRVRVYKAADLA